MKINPILVSFLIPVVTTISVVALLELHAERLQPPFDVIVVLLMGFGPTIVILWYWINRFYFENHETKKSNETKESDEYI